MTLARAGRADIKVYQIDTVEVPGAHLGGNKARVVALADQLEAGCARDLIGSVACVVDTDLDLVLNRRSAARLLIYSSGTSLDVVLAEVRVLNKLLSVVLLDFPISAQDLLTQLLPVLKERFLHRLANEALSLSLTDLEISRGCKFNGFTLIFELEEYLKRYLNKNARLARLKEFNEAVGAYRPILAEKPEHWVHVEDLIELLHLCVRKVKPKLVPGELVQFRRALFGLLEADHLLERTEVQEILNRLQPA